jgi:histidyl-tRNA synthetase
MADGDEPLRCRGMRDLLPGEMARYRQVEETFARVCGEWGYSEIRTPTIEFLHLFTAAGTLSPQMLERTYSFLDWDGWSGERVVLRPDTTIPAARLYVENLPPGQLARFFYTQNVFRFSTGEESREDWQCGVELIGDLALSGDIELILLGCAVLERLGQSGLEVGLSHAGLVRTVLSAAGLAAAAQVACYDRLLDGDLTVLGEIEAKLPDLKAPLHLLFDMKGGKASYLANLKAAFLSGVPGMAGSLDDLTKITATLDRLGRSYQVQTMLVRNFEYYTGPVFEFRAGGRRVGGGGRYDDLIALVGGESVPASGFALTARDLVSQTKPTAQAGGDEGNWVVRPVGDSPEVLAASFAAAAHLHKNGMKASIGPLSGESILGHWELTIDQRGGRMTYRLLDKLTSRQTSLAGLEEALLAAEAIPDD